MINMLFINAEFSVAHYSFNYATAQTCKVEVSRGETDAEIVMP
jgi:hypothetical protein